MTFFEYLIAAPWWHWLCFVLMAGFFSTWRPVNIKKSADTHEHKHLHTEKGS